MYTVKGAGGYYRMRYLAKVLVMAVNVHVCLLVAGILNGPEASDTKLANVTDLLAGQP